MQAYTCATCGKEWPTDYCPECAHTIVAPTHRKSPVNDDREKSSDGRSAANSRLHQIEKAWQREGSDKYVLKAATEDLGEYTPEVQTIILKEAQKRGLTDSHGHPVSETDTEEDPESTPAKILDVTTAQDHERGEGGGDVKAAVRRELTDTPMGIALVAGGPIGIGVLICGFALIYDCQYFANIDVREFKYGVVFTLMGVPLILFSLLAATRSVALRCGGLVLLVLALTVCSVARYDKYKEDVSLVPINRRGTTELVWAEDMWAVTSGVGYPMNFQMRTEHIREAHWYETGFAIRYSGRRGPQKRHVPLKYVPHYVHKMLRNGKLVGR